MGKLLFKSCILLVSWPFAFFFPFFPIPHAYWLAFHLSERILLLGFVSFDHFCFPIRRFFVSPFLTSKHLPCFFSFSFLFNVVNENFLWFQKM